MHLGDGLRLPAGRVHWTVALMLSTIVLSGVCSGQQIPKQSRILVYPFGHCLNSHLLNAERLAKILAEAGHRVDLLVSRSYVNFDNRRCSDVNSNQSKENRISLVEFQGPDSYVPVCDYDTVDFMLYATLKERFQAFFETSVRYCDALLSDRSLLLDLKATNYDLVIVESIDPCSKIIVDYLDIPFVLLVTTGLGHFDNNPRPPSYLPAAIAPFTSHMNFGQRTINMIMKVMYDQAIPKVIGILAPFEELKRKHRINTSLSLENSFDRASIKLVNSDFAVEYPAPIEPDTVLVGGFAVESPSPLSEDVQAFMDGSGDDGVIIMSFGTLVKRFDPKWTRLFADVFARLPHRVVWRHTGPIGDNYTLSPNIKLMRWLPQVSLLAHPKTRLIVSHCGLNSVFEAVRYSVPVLAVPLSGDQMNNAAKVTGHLRMGVTVDIHTMTSESLFRDIRRILDDRQFTQNAREVSRRLEDQPLSATAKIQFWVDYVIRHKGAAHLRSAANRLPWYQYLCLDVILCLLSIGFVAVFLFFTILWKLFRNAYIFAVFCRYKLMKC